MLNKFVLFSLIIIGASGCASLQPQINEASIKSYERGCALRGIQRGMDRSKAEAVCHCHIQKVVSATSETEFLEISEKLAHASKQERKSEAFQNNLKLMKSSFHECQHRLSETKPN